MGRKDEPASVKGMVVVVVALIRPMFERLANSLTVDLSQPGQGVGNCRKLAVRPADQEKTSAKTYMRSSLAGDSTSPFEWNARVALSTYVDIYPLPTQLRPTSSIVERESL